MNQIQGKLLQKLVWKERQMANILRKYFSLPFVPSPIPATKGVRAEDKRVFLFTVWFCFDVSSQMIRPKYWLFYLEITIKDWFTCRKNIS